jgi:hypothetical protein
MVTARRERAPSRIVCNGDVAREEVAREGLLAVPASSDADGSVARAAELRQLLRAVAGTAFSVAIQIGRAPRSPRDSLSSYLDSAFPWNRF